MAAPVDDLAELREAHAALNREHTALHDRYMRLLTQQQRWSERVRAAARRTATEQVTAFAHLHVRQAITGAGGDAVYHVLRLARELPERPKAAQVRALRSAAENAEHLRVSARDRDGEPGDAFQATRAEQTRLRDYIVASGRALHARYGVDNHDPASLGCECPGCQMIIGMDLVDDDTEPAPPGRDAMSADADQETPWETP